MKCENCGGDFDIYSECVICDKYFCLDCINEYNMCDYCYKNQPDDWKEWREEQEKNIQGNIMDIEKEDKIMRKESKEQKSLF